MYFVLNILQWIYVLGDKLGLFVSIKIFIVQSFQRLFFVKQDLTIKLNLTICKITSIIKQNKKAYFNEQINIEKVKMKESNMLWIHLRENRQSERKIMQSHYWLCTTKSTSGSSGTQKFMPLSIPYFAKDSIQWPKHYFNHLKNW